MWLDTSSPHVQLSEWMSDQGFNVASTLFLPHSDENKVLQARGLDLWTCSTEVEVLCWELHDWIEQISPSLLSQVAAYMEDSILSIFFCSVPEFHYRTSIWKIFLRFCHKQSMLKQFDGNWPIAVACVFTCKKVYKLHVTSGKCVYIHIFMSLH